MITGEGTRKTTLKTPYGSAREGFSLGWSQAKTKPRESLEEGAGDTVTNRTDTAGPHGAPGPAGEAEAAQTIMNNALNNDQGWQAGRGL